MHSLYPFSFLTRSVLAAFILSLLLSGCTARTSVSSSYTDKQQRNPRFTRALVVAVTATPERRLSFERAVVKDLAIDGTEAWPSAQLMNTQLEINQDNLRSVVEQQQADVVIVTRVTAMEVVPVEVEGRSAVLEEQQQSGENHIYKRKSGTLFRYDYEEDVEASYVTTEYTTELKTEVFAAQSGELIYTIVSRVSKVETINEVIDVLSDEIAKRLRRDGVIK
jgi:PBP1b-binding outer membrane lipoprotein LpoB